MQINAASIAPTHVAVAAAHLDLDLVERLAVVDADEGADHLGQDDDVAEVRPHGLRLLVCPLRHLLLRGTAAAALGRRAENAATCRLCAAACAGRWQRQQRSPLPRARPAACAGRSTGIARITRQSSNRLHAYPPSRALANLPRHVLPLSRPCRAAGRVAGLAVADPSFPAACPVDHAPTLALPLAILPLVPGACPHPKFMS